MSRFLHLGFLAVAALLAAILLRSDAGGPEPRARLRRPVAVVPADGGRRLFIANRDSGSVSVLDMDRRRVIAEVEVGRRLADLVDAGAGRLLAVDESAGELILLRRQGDSLAVAGRLAVGASPVCVRLLSGGLVTVSCQWPRQVVVVDLPREGKLRIRKKVELPFAPRLQLALNASKVLVADAFSGRLAVVDAERGTLDSVRRVPGHNIRGLAMSPDGKEVILSHQLLSEETPTQRDDIRWGGVIANALRSLEVADVLQPDADLLRHTHGHPLGDFRRGAADPAGLAIADRRVIVALAGTGEVALGIPPRGDWQRIAIGRRPTAVAIAGRQAFVVDTFADSVTLLDIDKGTRVADVSLGAMPELTSAQRGELLFYDGRLSVEGWMSCHSCHSDGHTSGLRSDTLTDGSYGAAKRVPTLLGAADTGPWGWNGSVVRLEVQVRQSVKSTMHGPPLSEQQAADLTAYLNTLPPLPHGQAPAAQQVQRGKEAFAARGCIRCHAPPTYTTPRTYEVGLEDEMGLRAFNPPSLRGVSHGYAFFHDSRAARLDDVLAQHGRVVPADIPAAERKDLLAFLRSL